MDKLAALLATAPTPARGGGRRAQGQKLAGAKLLETIVKLLLLHDRSIQALEDRTSVALLFDMKMSPPQLGAEICSL